MIGSILFNIAFWLWGVVMTLLALPVLLMPRATMVRHAERWERGIQWLLRTLVGLDYRVLGEENRRERAVIYAIKHQSAWDTVTTHLLIDDPAIALKQELTKIPIFGPCLRHAGMIEIARGQGTRALRSLIEGARAAIARGSPVVIFPEGTRVPPGEKGEYHPGVAALYKQLQLPVVPVALNSGLFWARRSFIKRPGTIQVSFLEPIQPGLERKPFMAELERRIEAETDRLIAGASEKSAAA
ncbi:MAG: lysophospholipid acyltransferase family protein [Alphaproteobacteria bacterium]